MAKSAIDFLRGSSVATAAYRLCQELEMECEVLEVPTANETRWRGWYLSMQRILDRFPAYCAAIGRSIEGFTETEFSVASAPARAHPAPAGRCDSALSTARHFRRSEAMLPQVALLANRHLRHNGGRCPHLAMGLKRAFATAFSNEIRTISFFRQRCLASDAAVAKVVRPAFRLRAKTPIILFCCAAPCCRCRLGRNLQRCAAIRPSVDK